MNTGKNTENRTLSGSLKRFSVLLVALTSIVTIAVCSTVCGYVIMRRNEEINTLKAEAAATKTNEAMTAVEEAVNLVLGADQMREMLESGDESLYSRTMLARNMEAYLSGRLMFDNYIDTVLFAGNNHVTTLYNNTSNTYYGLENTEWYRDILTDLNGKSADYSLYSLEYPAAGAAKSEKICIVHPLYYEEDFAGCLILFLNKNFVGNFTFSDNSVFLEDQDGRRIAVKGEGDSFRKEGWTEKETPLNLQGWKVIHYFSTEKIHRLMKKNQVFCLCLSALFLLAAWQIAGNFGKRLLEPVYNFKRQIQDIREVTGQREQIRIERNGSLLHKVSVYFMLLIICTIAPLVMVFYYGSNRIIEDSVGSVLEFNVGMIMQQADLICNEYESVLKEIAISDPVQEYMNSSRNEGENNRLKEKLMSCQIQHDDIVNIAFFDRNGQSLCSTYYNDVLLEKSGCRTDTEYVMAHYGTPLFRIVTSKMMNRECIRMGIQVININPVRTGSNVRGVLLVDLDAAKLMECISNLKDYRNVQYGYVDLEGTDLFGIASDNQIISKMEKEGDCYLYSQKTASNGWDFTVAIPWKEYRLRKYQLGYVSVLLFLFMMCVGFGFEWIFRKIFERNMKELLRVTQEVKTGNLQARYKGGKEDELGELGEQFNRMLERIHMMMEERVAFEVREKDAVIKVKELELELMQAQIKPHFLYNTLRAIEAMVILNDASAVRMIELLIKLFRTGISRGNTVVSLEEELEHVRAYTEIELIRHQNKFEVIYDVPEELLKKKVLKLTLQPLVENAILHGIFGKKDGGRIIIRAEEKKDCLIVSILDNGTGMSRERLEKLRSLIKNGGKEGIGLHNVNARIELKFGKEYGIYIDSQKNEGTRVRAVYPA